MKTSKPPSGRTIVTELLREMEERLYPLLYRTLPPSVYHVYLHPDDYREVEALTPLIVADAQQGLNARVDELNSRSRWPALVGGKRAPVEVPPGGWEIHIHPATNGELVPGEIGIESRLSMPQSPRFEGGTPTTRIVKTVVTGTIRRSAPSLEPGASEPGTSARPSAEPTLTAERAPELPVPDSLPARGAATLAYVDDEGPHLFVVRKDLISIGRGGSAHWVDVQVATTPKVSREHCRIRRAPDGRFFLQDVSTWGTSIDGRVVAPFVRQADGGVQETGIEHELTAPARIQLADAVTIEFTVEP
jgi:hypothetical protein